MSLPDAHARQIATLLNTRNQLSVRYDSDRVKREEGDYILRLSPSEHVIACVQLKRVQWYQFEVSHLTVAKASEGQGLAKALLCEAERKARAAGARLLQCTIREGNVASRNLFEAFGFVHVSSYHNERTDNNVGVYQKVLAPAR
jgi:ribosomal protein S18 acetylase RimI-like enzyme